MDSVRSVYHTSVQAVTGFARPAVDTVKRKFTEVAGAAQNNVPIVLTKKSYAGPLVTLGSSAPIDDRKNQLATTLEDYAKNRKDANPKDQDKINATMVQLFHKMTMSQDSSTGAKDGYYNCVNSSATQGFEVTPEHVYDRLLSSSSSDPRNHPGGISSLAFAFAAILGLSLHRDGTPQSGLKHNKTSPYFDLSPLYGENEMDTSSIRMKDGRGALWPDSFTEERLDMLPDSVPALLVLLNRYHNYVAKQLLSYNEEGQWKDPDNLTTKECSKQDDEIFHVARSITCIHFINIVREDFLKGLVGMTIAGPSAQFDILYDVRGTKNDKAGYLSSVESYLLYSFSSFAPSSLGPKVHDRLKQRNEASVDPDMRRRNRVGNLHRNKQDCFEDDELAELLFDAIEVKAGCPGGKATPDWAREREILKLRQARQANVCTLNEFRQHLGLKPLQSFDEWNPELANIARDVYDDINKLELYPGLLCERSNGHGFGFGYTMTWGLMADIVTRIRCDPMFTSNFKKHVLTKWGYNDCMSGIDVKSPFYSAGGSLGGTLPKLLQRTLPHNCPYNNVYCLFPFVVPEESNKYVGKNPDQKYKADRPKQAKIKVLRTLKAISEVLNDPKIYTSPYKQNLIDLTGGYGHMLGFDDLPLHDHDLMLTLFSLMPDKGAVMRIGASFAQKAQENLQRRAKISDNEVARIDVIQDVIDATCIRWVCETLYNFTFEDDTIWRMSESQQAKAKIESQKKEKKERDDFAAYYAYIFRNSEPEFGWNVRERALTASRHLHKHLKEQLPKDKDQLKPHHVFYTEKFYKFLVRISKEYTSGIMLSQHSPLTFLDRMMKASHLRPLKRVTDGPDHHISQIKERYKQEALKGNEERQTAAKGVLFKSLLSSDTSISEHEADGIAAERLEEERVIANVIGLAVVITVHFSKACARVVDFYLDEKYSREREKLVELCRNPHSSNEDIMKYIREAQRISQRFGLWRNVNLLSNERRVIEQGFGYPSIIIEPGDRVYADFTFAHNDPKQFPKPGEVQPGRPVNSLLGLGVHKCPAGSFIDQTMPPILRAIFKQQDLSRASGREGQLKSVTLHPDAAPWDSEIYLDEDGGFTYYPKQLVVEFNSSDLKKQKEQAEKQTKKDNPEERYLLKLDRGCSILHAIIILALILRFFTSFSLLDLFSSTSTHQPGVVSQINTPCGQPLTTIEDWHIRAFRPKWFGLFGEPTPIIYRTPRGRKAHLISMVDLDKRDIELQTWVDKEYMGSRPVELNSTVDCGEDVAKCLDLDFGSALFVVPPGRHTVRAEIMKRDTSKAFVWGKERQRRVMWLVQACANPTTN